MKIFKALSATVKNMKAYETITNSIMSSLDGYITPCVRYYIQKHIPATDNDSQKKLEIMTTGLETFCSSTCIPISIANSQQIDVITALYPIYENVIMLYKYSSNFKYNGKTDRNSENKYLRAMIETVHDNYSELIIYTARLDKKYLFGRYENRNTHIYNIMARVDEYMYSFAAYKDKTGTTNIDIHIGILCNILLAIIEHILVICDLVEY